MTSTFSTDYITYCSHCSDLNTLAHIVQKQYMPLITKYAHAFVRQVNSKIEVEDFISETYFHIIHQMNFIDLNKIENPIYFTFHSFVKNAVSHTKQTLNRKESKQHYSTLEFDAVDYIHDTIGNKDKSFDIIVAKHTIKEIYKVCNPIQKKILIGKYKGFTFEEIAKKLGVTKQWVHQNYQKIQKKCEKFNYLQ